MKDIPLQGKACISYERYTLTRKSKPVYYMKDIPLQGKACILYERYTLTRKILYII